jgi:Raf kinase inhibitor-like YbhB/YbcL family protein
MQISSPQFANGGEIPATYTCEGNDISPPLAWTDVPANTKSLALIVDDPDAPDPKAPKRTFVHWVIYNVPATTHGLPEAARGDTVPKGAVIGENDWGKTSYGGPCPPIGRHRYFFKLYALDVVLEGLGKPSKANLEQKMQGHVLGKAELIGTYEKRHR